MSPRGGNNSEEIGEDMFFYSQALDSSRGMFDLWRDTDRQQKYGEAADMILEQRQPPLNGHPPDGTASLAEKEQP